MTIDAQTLVELKEALLKEKASLENDLGKIAKPVNRATGDYEPAFEDIGTDREDNASEVEQYTDDLPVEITLEKKLKDVLEALEEMEEDSYGICKNCNQKISLERLRANPSARTCIKCI
ncbi:MAG: TraR/DksA C4-type zinc finger protein [Patescibacteria group bacterium]